MCDLGDERTDNRTEGQNNRLGLRLHNSGRSFWLFVRLLSKEIKVQTIFYDQMSAGGTFRKRSGRLQRREDAIAELQESRDSRQISTQDFITDLIQFL